MSSHHSRVLVGAVLAAIVIGGTVDVAVASPGSPAPTSVQDTRLARLQQRADVEIDRRLGTLANDKTLVDSAGHLSDDDRATLDTKLADDQSGLSALRTKIDNDTDLATAVTDARTIVTGYRVYVLVDPQVHLTIAAGRIGASSEAFADIDQKLQARIDRAKKVGKDTTAAQAALDDAVAKVTDATNAASGVPASVLPLQPSGYPDNRSTLLAARTSLETARTDLRAARADIDTVLHSLT